MTARFSTGLVTKMLDTNCFKTIMAACFIDIYSGTQPADADSAATGTKLCTIYSDGSTTGLHWDTTASAGVLNKLASEVWSNSGASVTSGTAGWFRCREASDSGVGASTTAARFDGAISNTGGAQMNVGSLTLTAGAPFVLPAGSITLPKV